MLLFSLMCAFHLVILH